MRCQMQNTVQGPWTENRAVRSTARPLFVLAVACTLRGDRQDVVALVYLCGSAVNVVAQWVEQK